MSASGYLHGYSRSVDNIFKIRPVVYLKADVKIIDGTGKSKDPYLLSIQ